MRGKGLYAILGLSSAGNVCVKKTAPESDQLLGTPPARTLVLTVIGFVVFLTFFCFFSATPTVSIDAY